MPKAKEKPAKAEKKTGVAGNLPSFLKGAAAVAQDVQDVIALMAEDFSGAIQCTREVYEAIPAYRQSDFKKWLENPMYYPFLKKYPPPRPAHFRDGSLFDALLFDTPEQVAAKYIVGPDLNRNTNAWKDFVAANEGKEIFKQAEWDQVEAYRASFVEHPWWINTVRSEHGFQIVFLKKHESGIWMKAMCDAMTKDFIVDAKLLADAGIVEFAKSYVKKFGYDIQAAWYRYCCPIAGIPLYFACQEKHGFPEKVPLTTHWFKPDDEDIFQAMTEINKKLPEFDAAIKSNKFGGYSEQLINVKAPAYYDRVNV